MTLEEKNGKVTQAQLYQEMTDLRNDLMKWRDWADARFVSKDEFGPIKGIAYGVVAIVGTAVVGALIALVVNAPK